MDKYISDEIEGVYVTRLERYDSTYRRDIYDNDTKVYVSEEGIFFTVTSDGIFKDTTLEGLEQKLRSRIDGEKITAYQVLDGFVHFAPITIYHHEGRYTCPDAPNTLKSLVILSEEDLKTCQEFKAENSLAYEQYQQRRKDIRDKWKEFVGTLTFIVS